MDDAEAGPSTRTLKTEDNEEVVQPKAEPEEDPLLADWFKVEEDEKVILDKKDYDSEATDDDSDNADVANEEPDNDLDDWFKIKSARDDPETKDEPVSTS